MESKNAMTFLEDGFDVLSDVVPASDCRELAARAESIESLSAGSRCLLDHGWCRQAGIDLRSRLADWLGLIAGKVIVQCTYFRKTASMNWFVAWHQDRSVPVASRVDSPKLSGWSRKEGMTFLHAPDAVLSEMIAVRLHLDDSTPENGPLRVIAGSHQNGTLSEDQIERAHVANPGTACLVRKGGVVLMHPLLLHTSAKSVSNEPRRVLHFLFGPPSLPHGLEWRYTV